MSLSDEKIKWTAADSLLCKHFAVEKEYYLDHHSKAMFKHLSRKVQLHTNRKSPLINRGYYARVYGNRLILSDFLGCTEGSARQLVYLGAGYDTDPLSAFQQAGANTKVFEIDFPEIVKNKFEIYTTRDFHSVFGEESESKSVFVHPSIFSKSCFQLIGADLRDSKVVMELLRLGGFDPALPTLVVSECVLVYIDREAAEALIRDLGEVLQNKAVWVTYDMVSPNDRYGSMMVKNLSSAGFYIPGMVDYPDLPSHDDRFLSNLWTSSHSITMKQFYNSCISDEEKLRLKNLEMFDEIEEWNMLMDHYTLTVATKNCPELDELLMKNIF